jgi:type VI secretion system protein ImpF
MQIDPGLLVKLGAEEGGVRPWVGLLAYKKVVSLDLERLLNTRRHLRVEFLDGFSHSKRSLVNFGVDDFSGKYFENVMDVGSVCLAISECIRLHEPRLLNVFVDAEKVGRVTGGLSLEISGQLVGQGVAEAVKFNATFDVATKKYEILAR